MTLKSAEQAAFDEFIMRFDDSITPPTAALLARELDVNFDPEDRYVSYVDRAEFLHAVAQELNVVIYEVDDAGYYPDR